MGKSSRGVEHTKYAAHSPKQVPLDLRVRLSVLEKRKSRNELEAALLARLSAQVEDLQDSNLKDYEQFCQRVGG